MNDLYVAAAGMASAMAALEAAGFNLANASTPGFVRFEPLTETVRGGPSPFQYASAPPDAVLSLHPSGPEVTGNPLDIYINGSAFMALRSSTSGEVYTRNGELSLQADAQGTLGLYAAGLPVLGQDGQPIVVASSDVEIGTDGTVLADGKQQGRIKLVDPAGDRMVPMGNLTYATASGLPLPPTQNGSVTPEALEMPDVNTVTDMLRVLDVGQRYENLMSAVHSMEQNMQQATQVYTLNA